MADRRGHGSTTPPHEHHQQHQRDSHDLSLLPRDVTRDSLVDNMLLSLGQLDVDPSRTKPASGFTYLDLDSPHLLNESWHDAASTQSPVSQHRPPPASHSRQYSYESDLDTIGAADDERATPPPSRGHWSTSARGQASAAAATASPSRQSSRRPSTKHTSRHGSKADKDSFDFKDVRVPSRTDSLPRSHSLANTSQPLYGNMGGYNVSDDDEAAAPVPAIGRASRDSPSASRRTASRPTTDGPVTPNKLHRKASATRSVKSSSGRTRPVVPDDMPAVPPLPGADDFDSAPAPNVGYNKKDEAPKEKQGFFRRVFGSSKSNSTMNLVSDQPPVLRHPISDRPPSNQMQQQSSNSTTAPPSRDATSSHSNHPALHKKSSFFRRRKKSNANEVPPMPEDVPPVPTLDKRPGSRAELSAPVSPTSSLRQVMNPYLHRTGGSGGRAVGIPKSATAPLAKLTSTAFDKDDNDDDDDDRRGEFKREFSPDYEPSPKAKIRAVTGTDSQEKDVFYDAPQKQTSLDVADNSFLNLDGGSDLEETTVQTAAPKDAPHSRKQSGSSSKQPATLNKTVTSPRRSNGDGKLPKSPPTPSSDSGSRAAPEAVPSVRVDTTDEPDSKVLGTLKYMQTKGLDEPAFVVGEPTEDERQKAQNIYDGEEEFISKEKAAAWMGEEGPVRKRTLQAYMELYNFKDQSILAALRSICGRLILKAETQQVDRILVAFSKRWCDCNPTHGFKSNGTYPHSVTLTYTHKLTCFRRHSYNLLLNHASQH